MGPRDVYKENGYSNREEYLKTLCEEYPEEEVRLLSFLLGPEEDFDGLVTLLEDLRDSEWKI